MADNFLKDILEHKKSLIKEKEAFFSSLKGSVEKCDRPHRFMQMITRPGQMNLIAEIKKASPSKGVIRKDFDPVAIAAIYCANNAAAISILTEDRYFLGKPELVKQVSEKVDVPLLTKDFIIDEGQIYEALRNGASAILLITTILDDQTLKNLINIAQSLGLDSLVEVHTEEELVRACCAGAKIIGVNNRDLNTFVVDMHTVTNIAPKIPKDKVIVAESGFRTHQEIINLYDLGVHAVLIGEAFIKATNIDGKIKEVMFGK